MDAETTRQIVTATAAVVAGLGGAGITGWINRKNTAATLEAARQANDDHWRRTRDRDHAVWLRDNREEAYVAFFDEAETHHARVGLWPKEELSYNTTEKLLTHRARLRLVASPEIQTKATEVTTALGNALIARNKLHRTISAAKAGDPEATGEKQSVLEDEFKSCLASVRQALENFSTVVRLDLLTTPDEKKDGSN